MGSLGKQVRGARGFRCLIWQRSDGSYSAALYRGNTLLHGMEAFGSLEAAEEAARRALVTAEFVFEHVLHCVRRQLDELG